MRAVVVTRPGGPEVLEWQEVEDPTPGPGEVLVTVAASAVNRAVRPDPFRGRNPSNTNRPAGNPLTTSAVTAADGPGTTSTG